MEKDQASRKALEEYSLAWPSQRMVPADAEAMSARRVVEREVEVNMVENEWTLESGSS